MSLTKVPDDCFFEIGRFLVDVNAKDDSRDLRPLMSTCKMMQSSLSCTLLKLRWAAINVSNIANPYEEVRRRRRVPKKAFPLVGKAASLTKNEISVVLIDRNLDVRKQVLRHILNQYKVKRPEDPATATAAAAAAAATAAAIASAASSSQSTPSSSGAAPSAPAAPPDPRYNLDCGVLGFLSYSRLAQLVTDTLAIADSANTCEVLKSFLDFYPRFFFSRSGKHGWTLFSALVQLMVHQRTDYLIRSTAASWTKRIMEAAQEDARHYQHSPAYFKLLLSHGRAPFPPFAPKEDQEYKSLQRPSKFDIAAQILAKMDPHILMPLVKHVTQKIMENGLDEWFVDDIVRKEGEEGEEAEEDQDQEESEVIKIKIPMEWDPKGRNKKKEGQDASASASAPAAADDKNGVKYLELSSDDNRSFDDPFSCFALQIIALAAKNGKYWRELAKEEPAVMNLMMDECIEAMDYRAEDSDRVLALACQAANACAHAMPHGELSDKVEELEESLLSTVYGRSRTPEEVDVALHALSVTGRNMSHFIGVAMRTLFDGDGSGMDRVSLDFMAQRIQQFQLEMDEDHQPCGCGIIDEVLGVLVEELSNDPSLIASWSFLRILHFTLAEADDVLEFDVLESLTEALVSALEELKSPTFDSFVSILGMGTVLSTVFDKLSERQNAGDYAAVEELKDSIAEAVEQIHNQPLKDALQSYIIEEDDEDEEDEDEEEEDEDDDGHICTCGRCHHHDSGFPLGGPPPEVFADFMRSLMSGGLPNGFPLFGMPYGYDEDEDEEEEEEEEEDELPQPKRQAAAAASVAAPKKEEAKSKGKPSSLDDIDTDEETPSASSALKPQPQPQPSSSSNAAAAAAPSPFDDLSRRLANALKEAAAEVADESKKEQSSKRAKPSLAPPAASAAVPFPSFAFTAPSSSSSANPFSAVAASSSAPTPVAPVFTFSSPPSSAASSKKNGNSSPVFNFSAAASSSASPVSFGSQPQPSQAAPLPRPVQAPQPAQQQQQRAQKKEEKHIRIDDID